MAWWLVYLRRTLKWLCLIWSSKCICVCEEECLHAGVVTVYDVAYPAENVTLVLMYSKLLGCMLCIMISYIYSCHSFFSFLLWMIWIVFDFPSFTWLFTQLLSQPFPCLATQQSPMLGYVFCVYVCVCISIRSDVRLHKDDVDICFSKTLNSCKVPQIRYASVERLLERLTDLRFLSIDFLNTFLHTYRIFTTATVVMDKLADIYKKPFSSIPIRSYNAANLTDIDAAHTHSPSLTSFF